MTLVASSRSPFGPVLDGASRARNGAREGSPVVSKGDSGRVNQGESARDRVQPLVAEMVREQRLEGDSLMKAYAVVGARIGVGTTWVRRLIGRQAVAVTGDRLLLIAEAYRAHCARVEARAVENRAATARRQEGLDAILRGLGGSRVQLDREPADALAPGPGEAPGRERAP